MLRQDQIMLRHDLVVTFSGVQFGGVALANMYNIVGANHLTGNVATRPNTTRPCRNISGCTFWGGSTLGQYVHFGGQTTPQEMLRQDQIILRHDLVVTFPGVHFWGVHVRPICTFGG